MFQYLLSSGSDFDRMVSAFKQGNAKFLLQFFDLSAEGWLAHKAVFCSLTKMLSFSNCDQVLEVTKFHSMRVLKSIKSTGKQQGQLCFLH